MQRIIHCHSSSNPSTAQMSPSRTLQSCKPQSIEWKGIWAICGWRSMPWIPLIRHFMIIWICSTSGLILIWVAWRNLSPFWINALLSRKLLVLPISPTIPILVILGLLTGFMAISLLPSIIFSCSSLSVLIVIIFVLSRILLCLQAKLTVANVYSLLGYLK